MIEVDGIPIEPEMAAEAVRRCTRAIGFIDRQRAQEWASEVLVDVKRILTGEWDGVDIVVEPEAEIVEVDASDATRPAPVERAPRKSAAAWRAALDSAARDGRGQSRG